MTFRLLLDKKQAQQFYDHLPVKSRTVVREHLLRLADDPYPGKGGDKEQLTVDGNNRYYRLHIGRSLTAIYTIDEDEGEVHVLSIMTIEQAHKKYGRLGKRR